MESYPELIRKDVFLHSSDASWPTSIVEFDKFLRNEMKIPSWFKQNVSGVAQLDWLFASDDASNNSLWDRTDDHITGNEPAEQRLRAVFNTALADCARIQAVIEAEDLTNTPFPKESFLVILVRNAISEVHPRLSLLEDVPVVLPRHFSGEPIPILKYMKKRIYAPLVVSIVQEMPMPIEENQPDIGHQLSLEEDPNSESEPELFKHEPPTLSEWLDACERPETPEESEDGQAEGSLSSHFEAYFLPYLPSATPPPLCHIPVLCMADEDRLPVLMSSLLYQRRVWHISDPLVGVEFSKHDTTIRLLLGWLEEDLPSSRVLPRVHLGEIRTPFRLDLSVPSVVLVVSRFLCNLESHIRGVCNSVCNHSVHAVTVISETRSHLSFPWRIDTDLFQKEGPGSVSESNNGRDMIIQWVESQKYSVSQASMVGSHKQDATRSGSATPSVTPQHSTSTQSSYPIPASQVGSEGTTLSLPEGRGGAAQTKSKASHQSYLPCSEFADTTKQTDYRMFRWMFDRRVVPQCIPFDLKFRDEYSAVTGLIWPETWNSREDLPSVDAALEPCIQELLESITVLKTRPGAVKCIPVDDFPVDLRVLEQSFSAIFQASRRSREKTRDQDNLPEMAWRHDHDRLLFDFFVRLVQPRKGDETYTPSANYPVAHFEDPFSRPILETTLRLPKNDNLQMTSQEELQILIRNILRREIADLRTWLQSRGIPLHADVAETQHSIFVMTQWSSWVQEMNKESEDDSRVSNLSLFACQGRCDALGRLLVTLPGLSHEIVDQLALVARPVQKPRARRGPAEDKTSSDHSTFPMSTSKGKGLTASDFAGVNVKENGTRYTMPSSPASASMHSSHKPQTGLGSSGPMDALACEVERMQLGTDSPYLELPILAVEYKKDSDGLMKGTNQLRMYLTASVKFLQAIGITNTAVYGVQTDGPIVVLPAAIVREDKFVYLFERLVEKLDISTPVGAWHYATILCRLAQNHAKNLGEKFDQVRNDLVASLGNDNCLEAWTLQDQQVELGVKKEPKKSDRKP